MSLNQLQVGVQQLADGANPVARALKTGETGVSEIQARYYENTYRGNVFGVSFPVAALAAASATVLGAFALFNPAASGKNLVIHDIEVVLGSLTAATSPLQAAVVAIPNQTPTSVGAGNTPICTFVGNGNASVAKTYVSGTTVAAPTTPFRFSGSFYLDLAASDVQSLIKDVVDGEIVIGQGSGIQLVALTTVPTNTVGVSITWSEVPA